MTALDTLRDSLPEAAKDIRLNLQAILQDGTLSVAQRYGVAVASAVASRDQRITQALVDAARAHNVEPSVVDDALAAASLMAMNNVYYRFRHMVGKDAYSQKPARLRMQRLARPASNKADFELFCLAVSAINGCETCIQSHERVVVEGGLSEDQIHDAVRIAATVHAFAVSLDAALVATTPSTKE